MIGPEEAWVELAAALKASRAASGLSGPALAERATDRAGENWSQSKVSRIENKVTKPSLNDVLVWAEVTGIPGDTTDHLLQLAERVSMITRSWKSSHRGGLAARQRSIAEIEARSTSVTNVESNVIPGLLQISSYAEQILRMRDASPGHDLQAAVAARLNRQAVLFDPEKSFTFVITEGVLRFIPEFADVRAAQAQRLLDMEARPNITIAVLPYSTRWPIIPSDGWMIFHVPGEPSVLIESRTGEIVLSAEADVTEYMELTQRALNASLVGLPARQLIHDTAR